MSNGRTNSDGLQLVTIRVDLDLPIREAYNLGKKLGYRDTSGPTRFQWSRGYRNHLTKVAKNAIEETIIEDLDKVQAPEREKLAADVVGAVEGIRDIQARAKKLGVDLTGIFPE